MLRKALPFLIFIGAAAAQTNPNHTQLDQRIRAAIARFPGTVSLYAKNLDSGESYGIREDERVRTASTIKLPIMAAIFNAVDDGRAKWDEQLVLRDSDKVSGSGVLTEFSDGDRFTIADLVHLMIVVSDNTATNLLLDRFTADSVNAFLDKLGLKQTRSLRKILGDGKNLKPVPTGFSKEGRIEENKRFGIGVSTPREMVMLLEKIARGQVVSAAASEGMLKILERQQDRNGIDRRLGETKAANKTGALDRLRSDVGIVYAPGGRIAMAITCEDIPKTDWSADNPGLVTISELTGILIDGLGLTQPKASGRQ